MKKLILYMNSKKNKYLLVVCALFSYSFEAQVLCNNTINPPAIIITPSGTINATGYTLPTPSQNNICTPTAGFAGSNPSWTGSNLGGTVTYTFSRPVMNAVVTYTSVNNDVNDVDWGRITINGIGTLSLSDACGADIISGNELRFNITNTSVSGFIGGDVSVTVNSDCPFTTITLTNIGNTTGWVQGNTCNFTWTEACDIDAPVFNTYSLSNTCPSETVDLSTLIPIGHDTCHNLSWHTAAAASDTNLLSAITSVGAGTYYASFTYTDGNFTCYSNTTAVTVNIIPCNPSCLPNATLMSPNEDVTNLSPFVNTGNPLAVRHLETSDWISASNIIGFGDNTFQNGVVYHAGDFIILDVGFEAVFESQFSAYIEDCPGNFVYRNGDSPTTSKQEVKRDFTIVPNPSSDFVKIQLIGAHFIGVTITSIEGRVVLDKQVKPTKSIMLNVNNFQKGIYIVNVQSDDGKAYSSKLIKE